jgi:Tfp pilus assembly protein PilO
MEPNNEAEKLHTLPKSLYMEYIKLFPVSRIEEVKSYTTIILTLLAIIFFSAFAIKPTIETILELRRQLTDSRFAEESLETKVTALTSLQQQYNILSGNSLLTVLEKAIPTTPEAPVLLGKIRTVADQTNVRMVKMETSPVELTKKGGRATQPSSFVFTVTVAGSYSEIISFLEALTTFDRILSLDEIAITTDNKDEDPLTTSIRARAYFHPEVL